jgi:hypothetical protein
MLDVDTSIFYLRRRGTRIQGYLLHGNEKQKILNSIIFRNGALVPIATESEEQVVKPLEMFLTRVTAVSK